MILQGMFRKRMLLRFESHFHFWTYVCEDNFLVSTTSYKAFFYVDAKAILEQAFHLSLCQRKVCSLKLKYLIRK